MPESIILYWRDIPSQVIVKRGRTSEKRELSKRFIEAIDMAAMRSGAKDADAYLAEWRRGPPAPCGDDLVIEADRLAAQIEADFTPEKLKALIANGGRAA